MKSFLKSEKEKLIKNFHQMEAEQSKSHQHQEQNRHKNLLKQNYISTYNDHNIKNKPKIKNQIKNKNINEKADAPENKGNYFNHEIISHYAEKLLRLEMSEAHQNAVLKIRSENSNPLFSNNDCSGNYSLFFIKNETLWEWREFSGELLKVSRNVKPEFAKELIYDYIKTKNVESEIFYEEDITTFAELTDKPLENIEASSKNCTLLLILTIVFLINFFAVFPQKAFYDIRQAMSHHAYEFIMDNENEILQSLETVIDIEYIGKSFLEKWFDSIYIPDAYAKAFNKTINLNGNLINYITEDTKVKLFAQTQGNMPVFNLSEMNRSIYINDINVYSGMFLSFEFLETTNATAASGAKYSEIPLAQLGYYGVYSDSYEGLNFEGEKDYLKPVYNAERSRYEIYFRPFYSEDEIKILRGNIEEAFKKNMYNFEVNVMLYNIDYNALYSFTIDLHYDAFGTLANKLYFNAMMPFIKFNSGFFLLIIILSIVFILGMLYLGFGHISSFISSAFDSINSKSNQLKFEEIFDLSIIILNVVSQVFFMVIFIFPSDLFPLKTANKDEFIYWEKKLNSVNSYQKITGVAIFFMIMRLLKFIMVAFPSFGIVFQTLKFAYKEIIAFFLLVCLMLGGIGSVAHASFGYHAKNYVDLSWAYFQVYLMFVGVFDFTAINNSEFSNPIAPVFFVVFMIIFNLILINLFISIILNNYREVKEKFQKFNNVYSIMVQEKIEEFTAKFWDLLIFKHPQQVEYEQKIKREKNNKNLMLVSNNNNNSNKNNNNNNNLDNENFNNKNPEENGEADSNRISRPKLSDIGLLEKLKYNFARLNLKQMLLGEGWNKEEFNAKKNELLQKMESKNLDETIKQYSMDYDNEFSHLAKTVFYVFYIVIFIFMMDFQLRLKVNYPVSFDFNAKYGIKFKKHYDSFSEVQDRLLTFVDGFYEENQNLNNQSRKISSNSKTDNSFANYNYNNYSYHFNRTNPNSRKLQQSNQNNNEKNFSYYYQTTSQINNTNNNTNNNANSTSLNNTSSSNNQTYANININKNKKAPKSTKPYTDIDCIKQLNPINQNNYIFLNQPFFRFTFRLFSVDINDDQNTKILFPFIKSAKTILDKQTCGGAAAGEFTNPIQYYDLVSKHVKQSENHNSAFDCGGFVFKLGRYALGCDAGVALVLEQIENFFALRNLNSVYLEFGLFHLFEDYAVLTSLAFVKDKLGEVNFSQRYDVVPLNRYVSARDFVRAILECLFLIISIFYLLFILWNILQYFVDSLENDFEQDEHKENFKDSFFLNKFFRINFNKFKNEGLLKSFCDMISTIIMKTLKAIFWLLEAVFTYLGSDGYNILGFIYLIITIAMIFAWYSILSVTNSLNFTQSLEENNINDNSLINQSDNLQLLSQLRDSYNNYFLFQAINGFILFLRLLGVFKFSQSINNLMTVVYKAKQVVIFHVFSMVFFNVGFCFAGYALFSQNIKEFSTLSFSFLQVLIIVVGNVDMEIFKDETQVFAVVFIFLVTFSNYLILLNILLSIVVHTFYDVKNENKINFGNAFEEDFLTKMIDIIYKKILLIFDRIEVYFYIILYYNKIANEKIEQFKNEIKEIDEKNKRKEEDNKNGLDSKTKNLSANEVIFLFFFSLKF